ncbi:MAG: tetratricopeptide repeat protein [Candidatus Omnitrophota bacterium]
MRLQRSCVLLLIVMSFSFRHMACAAESERAVSKANALYRDHKYDEAKQLYEKALSDRPGSAGISYNLGAAQFKTGDYEAAVRSFEKGLASEDRTLEFKSNYNIANSKFKAGMLKKETDPEAAVRLLNESLENYKRAIDLDPRDEDAKINYEFVDRVLKELKNKPQENKQERQKQGEAKEEKDKGESKEPQDDKQEEKPAENKQETQEGRQDDKKDASGAPRDGPGSREQQKKENDEQPSSVDERQEMKEMSSKEAAMLLDGYRQEEDTRGLLKDQDRMYQEEVTKDW